jgi:NADH-quinone oxidoreductase subunit L
MVAAVGLGAYVAAIFHLLTHGLFKALLFLGSGSVIHGTHETQDMRKMGGLKKDMPITFWTYLIGTLALAGIPIFAGFWSKDEIIAAALGVATIDGQWIILVILVVSAMLTAFYMARQVVLVFFGQQRDKSYHAHESGSMMTWPLIILAVGTIIGGAMNLPEPLPGAYALEHWLEPVVHPEAAHETTATLVESATHGEEGAVAGAPGAEETKGHSFNLFLATVVTLLSLASGFLGWNYYMGHSSRLKTTGKDAGKDPLRRVLGDFWEFMEEAWGFDDLYQKYTVVPWYRHLSDFLARVYDQQGIDGMVNGIGRMMGWAAASVRAMQSGYVRNYALMFLTGVIIIIGYLVAML